MTEPGTGSHADRFGFEAAKGFAYVKFKQPSSVSGQPDLFYSRESNMMEDF